MTDSLLPAEIVSLARQVIEHNLAAGQKIAVAESCTGGLVAAALTEIAG
ncbi:CinA family protein, partial [Acinetobacter baumannii]